MPMARLIKQGESVSVTIPSSVLKDANLDRDVEVRVEAEGGAIVIRRLRKRRTLQEILADCDLSAPASAELMEFDAAPPVGAELL